MEPVRAAERTLDELEDFFTTPRPKDDKALSTEGIEELFDAPRGTTVELDDPETLFAPPPPAPPTTVAVAVLELEPVPPPPPAPLLMPDAPAPAPEPVMVVASPEAPVEVTPVDTPPELPPDFSGHSMNELLEMLAHDLRNLAEEIGKIAEVTPTATRSTD